MGILVNFLEIHFNTIGVIGVFLVLLAYLLLQLDRWSQDSVLYSLSNFIGSMLILVSLYFTWNLASGVIEIAWLLISAFGLIKALRMRARGKRSEHIMR